MSSDKKQQRSHVLYAQDDPPTKRKSRTFSVQPGQWAIVSGWNLSEEERYCLMRIRPCDECYDEPEFCEPAMQGCGCQPCLSACNLQAGRFVIYYPGLYRMDLATGTERFNGVIEYQLIPAGSVPEIMTGCCEC